ncbi:hypothetical protein B0T13DRAFT_498565 [Neurospora crassa]|nr:hypothetical protein B0T13DRAFT_498565 [Neurospora crassa]
MASPAPEPPSTGVVALDSARRTLSVILADRATDIHYSAEALLRLTKLLPRSIRTFDKMNQASQVAKYFLLPSPKCKSNHKRRSDYIDEACALYHSIAEGLERLHINEDIYRFNLQNHGHLFMNEEIRSKRLLKVQGDVESLCWHVYLIWGNPTSSSNLGHHIQPVWIDEQAKIPRDELRHQWLKH